jgi:regulatory protein
MAVFIMTKEITGLKPNKNNKNRIDVYIDGKFNFGVSQAVASQLNVGQFIGGEEIAQFQNAELRERAWQSAMRLFNFRNRSEYEIRSRLAKKGFNHRIIDQVIIELKARSILNDAQFAQQWVESRAVNKPRGRKLFALELKSKSVKQEDIDQAFQGLPDEETLALNAGRRILRRYVNFNKQTFMKKMYEYLYRKGFTYHTIRSIEEVLWCEIHDVTNDLNGRRGDYGY